MKNRYYTDRANRLTNKIKSSVCEYNKLIRDLSTELDRLEESEEYYRIGFVELYKRIDDVSEDLKQTLEVNKHYKDKNNDCIFIDTDHINYLIYLLTGDDKIDKSLLQ